MQRICQRCLNNLHNNRPSNSRNVVHIYMSDRVYSYLFSSSTKQQDKQKVSIVMSQTFYTSSSTSSFISSFSCSFSSIINLPYYYNIREMQIYISPCRVERRQSQVNDLWWPFFDIDNLPQ